MKVSMIALAFAAFATTASAYAATPADANAAQLVQSAAQQRHQWTPEHASATAKTRQEVRQELVRAQKDGQLAALNKLYQGS